MNKSTTALFIGHKDCSGIDRERLRIEIINLIDGGFIDFLSGGMGNFDTLCARTVHELKSIYPHISCHLVIPYLTMRITEKQYYDSIIYPEGFEKYHFKAAIPKRNQYMVQNSTAAICFVTHDWGGAFTTYSQAKKAGVMCINLGE